MQKSPTESECFPSNLTPKSSNLWVNSFGCSGYYIMLLPPKCDCWIMIIMFFGMKNCPFAAKIQRYQMTKIGKKIFFWFFPEPLFKIHCFDIWGQSYKTFYDFEQIYKPVLKRDNMLWLRKCLVRLLGSYTLKYSWSCFLAI